MRIPVYIGTTKRFDCIKGMTERSILEHTSADVDIIHLYPEIETGCTGFSNVRYTIRKGIYLDIDMIVLGDIAELWEYRKAGKFVCMADGSDEVAVIDCGHNCRNKRERHKLPISRDIPTWWNVTDAYWHNGEVKYHEGIPDGTKLFHFTALPTQPWFYEHPNKEAIKLYERYKPNP